MAYGESNGHVTDDVTWLRKVKLSIPIRLEPNISKTVADAVLAYLATMANILLDSLLWACEALRSDILATAWLLVVLVTCGKLNRWPTVESATVACRWASGWDNRPRAPLRKDEKLPDVKQKQKKKKRNFAPTPVHFLAPSLVAPAGSPRCDCVMVKLRE